MYIDLSKRGRSRDGKNARGSRSFPVLLVSGVAFVRVVEPLGRGHGATAEHPAAAVARGRRGGAAAVTVFRGRSAAVLLLLALFGPVRLPERRAGRAVGAAQVVAVLVGPEPDAPVLGELGRGTGQRGLAERSDQAAGVVVRVVRRAAPVRLLVVVVHRAHVAVVVRKVRPPEVHGHLAH